MADEKSKLELQLTQEQIEYLLKKTGATDQALKTVKMHLFQLLILI